MSSPPPPQIPPLPASPLPVPRTNGVSAGGWLVEQLPICLAGDEFLRRFVGIFGELADGLRDRIDSVEHAVDVTVAPPAFVRWLGGWLDIASIDPSLPVERQRALVREFGRLLAQRGTRAGLREAIQLVTGERVVVVHDPGSIVAEGNPPPAGRVRIEVPATGAVTEADLVALVREWVPAAAGAELWVGDRRLWEQGRERQ